MLMAHDSPESFLQSGAKLLQDAAFLKAAAPILDAPMKDPIYTELKSSLMYGFEKCPAIEVPTLGKDRVLQMRFYRSYNLERNAAKVHMFDHGGELPLFRKSGMPPVFFGDTIIGDFQPNLTYMLSFENEEARKLGWKTFVSSDEWKDISTRDMYKDTAHQITNILLRPSPGSQI